MCGKHNVNSLKSVTCVIVRSSNPSESFRSTTCLEKVCLALQKFHKAQTTNRQRILYVIKLNSGQRVDRRVGGIGFLTFTKYPSVYFAF